MRLWVVLAVLRDRHSLWERMLHGSQALVRLRRWLCLDDKRLPYGRDLSYTAKYSNIEKPPMHVVG